MESSVPEGNYLMSIGLMMTYRCTAACPHCIVEAGPHRRESIRVDEGIDWISQMAQYRDETVRCLALTGGEPFCCADEMRALASHASSNGLLVSVVTNGFWARSRQEALDTLASIPGLGMVSLSTDLHHQRFIPLQNIENAIWALEHLNLVYNIAVCREIDDDPAYQAMVQRLLSITDRAHIKFARSLPLGRLGKRLSLRDYETTSEPSRAACSMASYPVIFPEGRVVACIGPVITLQPPHPLILGDMRKESLAVILDRAQGNPILHAIRIWGPHRLLEWLRRMGDVTLPQRSYIRDSVCDACYRLTTDPALSGALERLAADGAFGQEVAYGRAYHLGEAEMAEAVGLLEENGCQAG